MIFGTAATATTLGWPVVLLALAGAAVVAGGLLWLIAAGARRLNHTLHGPGIQATATQRHQPELPWRVHATATDLPPDATRLTAAPRALPAGRASQAPDQATPPTDLREHR